MLLPDGARDASCKSPSPSELISGPNGVQLQANAPIRGPWIHPPLYPHLEIRSPPQADFVGEAQIGGFQGGGMAYLLQHTSNSGGKSF